MPIILLIFALLFPYKVAKAEEIFQLEVSMNMSVESLESRLITVYGKSFKQVLFVSAQGAVISSLPTVMTLDLGKEKIVFPPTLFASIDFDINGASIKGITINPSVNYLDIDEAITLRKTIEHDFENKNWKKIKAEANDDGYSISIWKLSGYEAMVFVVKRGSSENFKNKDLFLVEIRIHRVNESKDNRVIESRDN